MIGKIVTIQNSQIVDKYLVGDIAKIFFKTKDYPGLIFSGNLVSMTSNGRYTILVTGDDKENLEPEAQYV
jgi:hypothetical protein